jgi:DNA polymerase III subunit gamma/tau
MIEQGGGSSPVIGQGNGNGGGRAAPMLNAPSAQSSVQMPSSAPPSAPTMSAPRGPTMQRGNAEPMPRPQVGMAETAPVTVRKISTFPELIALAGEKRDVMVRAALESDVRLIRIEDGRLEVAMERTAARSLINDLSRKLEQWTGRRWHVIVSNAEGQATVREQQIEQKNERQRAAEADPRVQAVFATFPGAKMEVRVLAPEIPEGDDDALISDDGADAGDDD